MHSYFLKQIFTVTFYNKIEIISQAKKKYLIFTHTNKRKNQAHKSDIFLPREHSAFCETWLSPP